MTTAKGKAQLLDETSIHFAIYVLNKLIMLMVSQHYGETQLSKTPLSFTSNVPPLPSQSDSMCSPA